MIAGVIDRLFRISDQQWWQNIFARDPMNGRLNSEQRAAFIEQSVEAGEKAARALQAEYGLVAPEALAEKLGVHIQKQPQIGADDYIFFASFTPPDEITLYEENMAMLKDFAEEAGIADALAGLNVPSLLIAHELYHVYEDKTLDCFTKDVRFVSHALGPIRLKSRLVAPSEIAAMSFARVLTGAQRNPCILDVLLLMPHKLEKAVGILEGVEKCS